MIELIFEGSQQIIQLLAVVMTDKLGIPLRPRMDVVRLQKAGVIIVTDDFDVSLTVDQAHTHLTSYLRQKFDDSSKVRFRDTPQTSNISELNITHWENAFIYIDMKESAAKDFLKKMEDVLTLSVPPTPKLN